MSTSQQSTQYTAMYNTFKTYIHGKDIDTSYSLDYEKEKEKNKTNEEFYNKDVNKSNDKYIKSENNLIPNLLNNSSDSNNNIYINNSNNNYDNIKKYEMARYGPMQKITEDDRENEETFQNEEPKFYDEYDEQYVKILFNLFFYFSEILFVGIAKLLLQEEKLGKMLLAQNVKKLIKQKKMKMIKLVNGKDSQK